MFCDYNSLANYAGTLSRDFGNLTKIITSFEDSMNSIMSLNMWDSETRDYLFSLYKNLQNNFDIVNNKFNNINQYVDMVINNYKNLDAQLGSAFGG